MTTTFFFVSLVALCALLASKSIEIKLKRGHFISNLFKMGDESIHNLIDTLIFKYHRYKIITNIFIFEFLPSYAYEMLVKAKDYVSKKYYSTENGFRGRRILKTNGSVSFFLERLSEDKPGISANDF
jgi:hypothetical protein